jgi:phosphatidylglycerophosphate synthase
VPRGGGPRWNWSNALTAFRLFAALPVFHLISTESWGLAWLFFWLAVASDVADGRIARARGETSAFGGFFDHATDAVFVSSGLWALGTLGLAPVALAPFVVAAFLQYALDSRALAGRSLRASALGRWNGIFYFVPVGVVTTRGLLGLEWPPDAWLMGLGWALTVSSAISMLDRLFAFVRRD